MHPGSGRLVAWNVAWSWASAGSRLFALEASGSVRHAGARVRRRDQGPWAPGGRDRSLRPWRRSQSVSACTDGVETDLVYEHMSPRMEPCSGSRDAVAWSWVKGVRGVGRRVDPDSVETRSPAQPPEACRAHLMGLMHCANLRAGHARWPAVPLRQVGTMGAPRGCRWPTCRSRYGACRGDRRRQATGRGRPGQHRGGGRMADETISDSSFPLGDRVAGLLTLAGAFNCSSGRSTSSRCCRSRPPHRLRAAGGGPSRLARLLRRPDRG